MVKMDGQGGGMDGDGVERLLRQYAKRLPPQRLMSERAASALRARLSRTGEQERLDHEAAAESRHVGSSWTAPLIGLAVAACLTLMLTISKQPPSSPIKLLVDGAHSPADVFKIMRSPSAESEANSYFVGVQVNYPAYVRIVIFDSATGLESLELDGDGAEQHFLTDEAAIFGSYDLRTTDAAGIDTVITDFLIVASTWPLDPEVFAEALQAPRRAGLSRPEDVVPKLIRELHRRFDCTIRVLRP